MTFGRRAYVFLCWAYLVVLPVQFLLAGMGVMGGDLEVHMAFGGLILHIVIPALMLIFALIGRAWSLAGWAFALFALLTLQIMMVSVGREAEIDLVAGIHLLVAFLSWPFVYFVLLCHGRAAVAQAGDAAPAAA